MAYSGHDERSPWTTVALVVVTAVIAALVGGAAALILSRAHSGSRPAAVSASKSASRASRGHGSPAATSHQPVKPAATTPTLPPPPLHVQAISPGDGAKGISGSQPIRVRFTAAISPDSPLPSISPAIPGKWERPSAETLEFVPAGAFLPDTTVSVQVPAGRRGILAADGARMPSAVQARYLVRNGSVLRLQQLLSVLRYSPLAWEPRGPWIPASDAAAQAKAAFSPPAGSFHWAQKGWPVRLTSTWKAGKDGVLTKGLVMAFEADHGLTIDGIAGPEVWGALLKAVATKDRNRGGYTYALASKGSPESLTVWHNGRIVLKARANTGIPQAGTADGTFPVYERLRRQVMKGTNPDGSKYADPVQYVAYFHGGDAVHYIPRASYGYPQSLGCVELPLHPAAVAWSYLAIGSLVTVA